MKNLNQYLPYLIGFGVGVAAYHFLMPKKEDGGTNSFSFLGGGNRIRKSGGTNTKHRACVTATDCDCWYGSSYFPCSGGGDDRDKYRPKV